jgi:hypothetical protein
MFNLDAIDNHFPIRVDGHPSYREGQRGAIEFALKSFNEDKQLVIIEGPTGSGKSAVGMTICDMVDKSYYLTGTKILQDQLVAEFGDQIVELKGRNAYPCTFYTRFGPEMVRRGVWTQSQLDDVMSKDPNCADGFCKTRTGKTQAGGKKFKCLKCFTEKGPNNNGRPGGDLRLLPLGMKYSACPYYEQVYRAVNGRKVTMNFSSFLFQTQMTKRFEEPRDLMVIDECLHGSTLIETEVGRFPICKIVNNEMPIRVWSYNKTTGQRELKPIVRWLRRSRQMTYKVLAGNRILYPTADHKIYTEHGLRRLSELKTGDLVRVAIPEITAEQEQLLLGSLLGDAALWVVDAKRVTGRTADKGRRISVRFRHGPKQADYIKWKYMVMSPHTGEAPILKDSAGFTSKTLHFTTTRNVTDLVSCTMVGDRKTPNRKWLDRVGPMGIAVWFMDDGSLTNGSARIHTNSFTADECELLANWLQGRLGSGRVSVKYSKKNTGYYYLSLCRAATVVLAEMIAPFVPPSMRYKLPPWRPGEPTSYREVLRNEKVAKDLAAPGPHLASL